MSLINEALKKAQREREESDVPPAVAAPLLASRTKSTSGPPAWVWPLIAGLAALVVVGIGVIIGLSLGNQPAAAERTEDGIPRTSISLPAPATIETSNPPTVPAAIPGPDPAPLPLAERKPTPARAYPLVPPPEAEEPTPPPVAVPPLAHAPNPNVSTEPTEVVTSSLPPGEEYAAPPRREVAHPAPVPVEDQLPAITETETPAIQTSAPAREPDPQTVETPEEEAFSRQAVLAGDQATPLDEAPLPQPDSSVRPDPAVIDFLSRSLITGVRVAGTRSRVLMNNEVYRIGSVVHEQPIIRISQILSQEIRFIDESGAEYRKQFR